MSDTNQTIAENSGCIDSSLPTGQRWKCFAFDGVNDMHPVASESMSSLRRDVRGMGSMLSEASQVFILTDENVAPFWLPEVAHWLHCDSATDIVIKAGEQHKNLQTVQRIWKTLMKHHADRNALLINLGGGVITDLGGFAASTYKRGIKFINIPTTLLAMVDAAIGGKTGIDFGGAKNQIGTFAEAEEVLINPVFLETLPERELRSGLAEMLKYGFISDAKLLEINLENCHDFILRAGDIKREIVSKDPTEKGLRKVLNFGHTIGHAIESHCLTTDYPLLHGEAVALGMLGALWLSVPLLGLRESVLKSYENLLPMLLSEAKVSLSKDDMSSIMERVAFDKKRANQRSQFVLLYGIGEPVWDVEIEPKWAKQALEYVINKASNR